MNILISQIKIIIYNCAFNYRFGYIDNNTFKVNDKVSKVGGDYKFDGTIVSLFPKLSGAIRVVVEDDRGVLHVYSEKNLKLRD